MPSFLAGPKRFGFCAKLAAALALVALADILFFGHYAGSIIGGFAIAWALTLAATVPAIRHRGALTALAAALLFGLIMTDGPSLLGWAMFWAALSTAALWSRSGGRGNAARWALRLASHGASSPLRPLVDAWRIERLGRSTRRGAVRRLLPALALPLAGGALFIALFAAANPLIGDALAAIRLPRLDGLRMLFWGIAFVAVWPSLRPARFRSWARIPDIGHDWTLPGVSVASVTLSLLLFNLLFAVQNALDLAFLWSGAPLPVGMTLADYAHRGAYPLIATALLAGLFVLVTLRPGSETAARPLVRRLVVLWIAQNILLVASSILRICDYIEVYSLTRLRIAALAWMALVAFGLALTCWRMLKERSASWLINANALAAGIVLALASMVDLGAVAATWNVRHAREAGGRGAAIDLCYLKELGPSALLPLMEFERRPIARELRDRTASIRAPLLARIELRQADWHGWTWRNARRLAAAHAMMAPMPAPWPAPFGRACDGHILPPPEPAPAVKTPVSPSPALTGEPPR